MVSKTNTGLCFSGKKDSWLRLQREVCGMHVFLYQLVFGRAGSQKAHRGGEKVLQDVRQGAMRCLALLDLPSHLLKSQSGAATAVAIGGKEGGLCDRSLLGFVCTLLHPPAED